VTGDSGFPSRDVPTAQSWIEQCEFLTSRRGQRIAFRRTGHGPSVLLLHGFPTWSYDYAAVALDLALDHDVITMDFLGYGASEKPNPHKYSVSDSADVVEDLAAHLQLNAVRLVVHDYGAIVGQELLDRALTGLLGFTIDSLVILNSGIVYQAYRPTRLQKLLALPTVGKLLASRITANRVRAGLDSIRRVSLTDAEFENLWLGISRDNGHHLAHLLIKYNAERDNHHRRWESALANWDGPMHLVWGLDDPVSGRHVLEKAVKRLPRAKVTRLADVGHFPQSEAPQEVSAALRSQP
jgi:pimeloyl-ACP methyl ester carboxylesterase